jgi:hypothetical protein
MKLSIVPEERGSKALARILSREEKTGSVAEKPASDGMFLIATDFCDPSIFNRSDDAAGIRTITVAKGLFGFEHVVGSIASVSCPLSVCPAADFNRCVGQPTTDNVHGYNKNFFLAVSNSLRSFCQVATMSATGSFRSIAFLTVSVPASRSKWALLN